MESLSDKLKSLGVRIGASNLPPLQPQKIGYPIEDIVNGVDHHNEFGTVFVSQTEYTAEFQHGNTPLNTVVNLSVLAQLENGTLNLWEDINRAVFLDTETSGLAGGTGTFAFLVGIAHRTPKGFRLVQFFMRDPGQEPALLAELDNYLAAFDTLVTFNGKSFDIPILNTRHILNHFPSPFKDFEHIDLLHTARRLWRNRLASRTLGNLENEILNFQRTQTEVPGWMVPVLYSDYLRTLDARPLEGVFYHNGMDVLSLAALFNHIANLLSNPLSHPERNSIDLVAIAHLYEKLQNYEVAALLYENGLEQGLPEPIFIQTLMRYAHLYRRQEQWDRAIHLWQKAAEYQVADACTELAKYYEHQQKNFGQAQYWTEQAVIHLQSDHSISFMNRRKLKELQHRKNRLEASGL